MSAIDDVDAPDSSCEENVSEESSDRPADNEDDDRSEEEAGDDVDAVEEDGVGEKARGARPEEEK